MKRLLLTTVAGLALCTTAFAADIPAKNPPAPQPVAYDPFVGWFLGVELGADWGHLKPSISAVPAQSPTGFAGGASLGYRSAVAAGWYLGLSTSLDFAGGSDTKAINKTFNITGKNDWFGATMVQAGFRVIPDLLIYGEGGVGYGAKKAQLTSKGFNASDREDGVGWAVGAGAEYNIRNLTGWPLLATLEYRHIDLGKTNFGASFGPGITVGAKAKVTDDALMAGVKVKFGS